MIEHFPEGVGRRAILAAGAVGTAGLAPQATVAAQAPQSMSAAAEPPVATSKLSVRLNVNGQDRSLQLDPRVTLLDALRDHLHLTGSKKGCDHGQCGACTVLVNDRRINACLSLAVMHDGDSITTIEGFGHPGALHPMQTAFVKHDGFQCGYCTPGQICSSIAVLQEIKDGIPSHVTEDLNSVTFSELEVRERMSGNICRCAAYPNIIKAISEVQGA